MKNCDRGLENAARGRRPKAAFLSPRSQFFFIRTDPKPANNMSGRGNSRPLQEPIGLQDLLNSARSRAEMSKGICGEKVNGFLAVLG